MSNKVFNNFLADQPFKVRDTGLRGRNGHPFFVKEYAIKTELVYEDENEVEKEETESEAGTLPLFSPSPSENGEELPNLSKLNLGKDSNKPVGCEIGNFTEYSCACPGETSRENLKFEGKGRKVKLFATPVNAEVEIQNTTNAQVKELKIKLKEETDRSAWLAAVRKNYVDQVIVNEEKAKLEIDGLKQELLDSKTEIEALKLDQALIMSEQMKEIKELNAEMSTLISQELHNSINLLFEDFNQKLDTSLHVEIVIERLKSQLGMHFVSTESNVSTASSEQSKPKTKYRSPVSTNFGYYAEKFKRKEKEEYKSSEREPEDCLDNI